jgi:GNAT superfamily N-acetyltransferase
MRIFCRDLEALAAPSEPHFPFRFRILAPAEMQERLAHLPSEHTPDIPKRIREGQTCLVAEHDGSVCCVLWAATAKCYSYRLDRKYPLANDEAYVHGAYTVPALRGCGLLTRGLGYYAEWLRARGVRRILVIIAPTNAPAVRAALKQRYRPVGTTGFVEVFGFRWYFHCDRGAFKALRRRYYWRRM